MNTSQSSFAKKVASKIAVSITYALRITLLFAAFNFILSEGWFPMFLTLFTLFLTFLPAILRRNYKIHLPLELDISVVLFVYASLFLGELKSFYARFWWWDILLHGSASIVLGFAGFMIIFSLWNSRKIKASPFMLSLFSFSFSMSVGALWEIVEFCMDYFLGTNMQKSGLVDTMTDLMVDAVGAAFVSTLSYIYVSNAGAPGFFERLVTNFVKKNPHLFGIKAIQKSKNKKQHLIS